MRQFFKIFLACFTALVLFSVLSFFIFTGFIGGLTSKSVPRISTNSVLVIDLNQQFKEIPSTNPLSEISSSYEAVPGIFRLLQLIENAKTDSDIKGIFLKIDNNNNGFGTSEELRNALLDFKSSNKFIIAYGNNISQKGYYIGNVADKIYMNPTGNFEWTGLSVEYVFFKGLLDKLEVKPQIFYAGKFKSATEPFRTDKMSDENRLQTSVWLNDLYSLFLKYASETRNIDTTLLKQWADNFDIVTASNAFEKKLVDSLLYDDEVKQQVKKLSDVSSNSIVSFISAGEYDAASPAFDIPGDKIAVIVAEGDIIDGSSTEQGVIADNNYIQLIRKAANAGNIKAIVLRINSGGGSAQASENIWRELQQAKKQKPVVVSFGDVAASGGYYIACAADSIFTQPGSITGSIGVFSMLPDLSVFFKSKLGITFDKVTTATYAGGTSISAPLNEKEKSVFQSGVNSIYTLFKQRVADGRKKDTAVIENIAQGRVWTGKRAIDIGLADRVGGYNEAVMCAASLAKTDNYVTEIYPQQQSFLQQLFSKKDNETINQSIKKTFGTESHTVFSNIQKLQRWSLSKQTALPYCFTIK